MLHGTNLNADSNDMVQTHNEEQDLELLSLRDLINKQLARVVEDLYQSFSVVQTAASTHDEQTARLVEENRRLKEVTSGKGELDVGGHTNDNGKVLQPVLGLGSSHTHRLPPTAVTVFRPKDPAPTLDSQVDGKTHETFASVMPSEAPPPLILNPATASSTPFVVTDFDLDTAQESPPKSSDLEQRLVKHAVMAPPAQAWVTDAHQVGGRCATCGSAIAADAAFCGKCGGRKQDGPAPAETEHKDSPPMHVPIQKNKSKNGVTIQDSFDDQRKSDALHMPMETTGFPRGHPNLHAELGTASQHSAYHPHHSQHAAHHPQHSHHSHAPLPLALQDITAPHSAGGNVKSPTFANSRKAQFFEVLPIWRRSKKHHVTHVVKATDANRKSSGLQKTATAVDPAASASAGLMQSEPQKDNRDRLTRILHIINPNDPRRGMWDMTSLFLVLYDMVTIPLEFFDPPVTAFVTFMKWTTRMFWSTDMPLSFLTGYVTHEGFIEMRPKMIAIRYAKSWLVLDILIVAVDWMEVVMEANSSMGFARMGKASRTFRIVRMLRLLRLARMREVLTLITERINSEKVVIIADILKALLIILALAHLIACVWFAVGSSGDLEGSWIDNAGYLRAPIVDKYFISLHWSIAQFAGGMDEVTPNRSSERIFAIGMFIFAFIVASVFVSSITSSMTQLNIVGSQSSQQVSALRRYLYQNGISNKLAVRVQRNAQHAVTEQLRQLPETAVVLLNVVSEPLRIEIHTEMYGPVLKAHPFFAKYIDECPQVMRKVCHIATQIVNVSTGDVIFCAGEIPSEPKMYIICNGDLEYEFQDETANLGANHWVSEAVLWVEWMHRGSLTALSDARLCVVDAKNFQRLCSEFSAGNFDPEGYAHSFVNQLNEDSSISDLPFDFDPNSADDKSWNPVSTESVMGTTQSKGRGAALRKRCVNMIKCLTCRRSKVKPGPGKIRVSHRISVTKRMRSKELE